MSVISKTINAKTGQLIVIFTIILSFISSILTLFYVGGNGAISEDNLSFGFNYLLKLYIPILGILLGFLLANFSSDNQASRNNNLIELNIFIISYLLIILWIFAPTFFLIYFKNYDLSIKYIESFKIYGELIASGAIAFYFSKSL